jgi:hypothetical protein
MDRPVVVVQGRLVPVPDGWVEGDWVVGVPPDRLLVVPARSMEQARGAVGRAVSALPALARAESASIVEFYRSFAESLRSDREFAPVDRANEADVVSASARGRATGRLRLDGRMRGALVEALEIWADQPDPRGSLVERIEHVGWNVEVHRAPLGVVELSLALFERRVQLAGVRLERRKLDERAEDAGRRTCRTAGRRQPVVCDRCDDRVHAAGGDFERTRPGVLARRTVDEDRSIEFARRRERIDPLRAALLP